MPRKSNKKTQKQQARKKKKIKEKNIRKSNLKTETLHWVFAILFFVIAIFLLVASFNGGGLVGTTVYEWLSFLFGIGYFLLPALFIILGLAFTKSIRRDFATIRIFGSILFVLSGLGIIDILFSDKGGFIGGFISSSLVKLFDVFASLIFLWALVMISVLVIFDTTPNMRVLMFWKKEELEEDTEKELEEKDLKMNLTTEENQEENSSSQEKQTKNSKPKTKILGFGKKETDEETFGKKLEAVSKKHFFKKEVSLPLNLLAKDKGKPGVGDIKASANIIKRTLQNFGINVEMDEISIGPSVTRYAMKPAEGIKLSRIVGLQNDLSLALAAHPLRIEAPIPGKALVGIEIPNSTKTTVGLGTLFASKTFQNAEYPLSIALGKDISGEAHFANLAKAPHMLIAGSTGSGKSVTIHTLITSLLFRNNPEELRFLMVDPKRVELTLYKNIPHLLTPVITDAKKAILALKWAIKEMERRYEILEDRGVRDIQSYHKNIIEPAIEKATAGDPKTSLGQVELPEAMPYIVVVIDELADIMQAYPRELEAAIVRLAQMSRAVGIHLILSTQRPSVNVITGLIKANVPTRVALQVASQIDSRTILDQAGAEKLLGAGDMLYLSGNMSKPRRIQAAFISEKEVKNVVKFLKNAYEDELPDEIDITTASKDKNVLFEGVLNGSLDDDDGDDLYEDAYNMVIEAGKASTSYLQRRLRVGYARAARLMDMLEDKGIIGPANGSKPREVLVRQEKEEVEQVQNNVEQEQNLDEEISDNENIDDEHKTEGEKDGGIDRSYLG